MNKTYKFLLSILLIIFGSHNIIAQGVKGIVKDAATGQGIPGTSVVVEGRSSGTATDNNGNYTLRLAPGSYRLKVSSIGYQNTVVAVSVSGTDFTSQDISLSESTSTLQEIAVIGSRSATARTNIQTATPVDVISTKELKAFGQVDVGQILNYVAPSFSSNRQTVTDGTDHIDPASLRGLGPDQVLVLLNGKRRHTTSLVNINGSVGRGSVGTDMNVIPVAAIERIEVLRDGAAAQYGSDAIAGVINIVLKKGYTGTSASLTYGSNLTTLNYTAPVLGSSTPKSYSKSITDGQVLQFDFSKGFRLGKEGSLTVSAQYNDRGRTSRTGLDNAPTIYLGANGAFPATPAGQDQTAFRTKLIADDATLAQSRNYNRENMIFGNSSAQNFGIFANGSIPLDENSEIYFSGGYTYRTGQGFGNNRIPVARNQQPVNSDGSLLYQDGFLPGIESDIYDRSILAGYKTKIGEWSMDVSNVYGNNAFSFTVFNSGNAALPAGQAQQSTFDAGKLWFAQNTFNLDFSRNYQKIGGFNYINLAFGGEIRIERFQIMAGELNSYFGAAVQRPTAPLTPGGASTGTVAAAPGSQVFPGYQPSDATDRSRDNESLYADFEAEKGRLLFGLAGRFENFSDFGSTLNGKATARLQITDGIALRGAVSTGFRAPSLHQRYFQNTSTQFINGLPSNTLTVNNDNDIARKTVGVDALRPEKSVNYSLGLTAKLGNSLTLTVDAYQIDITDRIVYSGAYSRAQLGITDPNQFPGVNNVRFFANAVNTTTQGIDIVATDRINIGKGKLTLSAALNFNKNQVTALNSTPLIDAPKNNDPANNPSTWYRTALFDRQQYALIETYLPRSKWNLSAAYNVGKLDVTFRAVRFGEVQFKNVVDPLAKKADGTYWNTQFNYGDGVNAPIDQTFSAVWISDLVVGYRLSSLLYASVGANNLFDVYPDQIFIDPRNAIGSIDYNASRDASNRGRLLFQPNQGGYNGRFVFAKLSVNF
ncbi:MAG: TonB-dependent receptor [Arcicella sp.]|jgi:iron complex outermembrane receptor protein|nr:TonB-dependent receptor [Arcicella sp.]